MRKALFAALAILGIAFGSVAVPVQAYAASQYNNDVTGQDGNSA